MSSTTMQGGYGSTNIAIPPKTEHHHHTQLPVTRADVGIIAGAGVWLIVFGIGMAKAVKRMAN